MCVFLLQCLLLGTFLVLCASKNSTNNKQVLPQTNLLFIMFDDLRPELSIYGKKHMITPNFERLATLCLCLYHRLSL